MLAVSALTLLTPYLFKIAVDQYITQGDRSGLGAHLARGPPRPSSGCMSPRSGQQYLLSWVGQRVLANLRSDLFHHLQRLSLSYHDTHIVGVTVSRVMNDVATINELLSQGVITLVGDTLVLVGIIVIMLTMNPRLALLTFLVLPLMVLVTIWFSRRARVAFRETRTQVAKVVGDLAEDIAGVRVIQAFGQENSTQERFNVVNEANRIANINAMTLSFIFLPAIEFLGVLSTAIVLWFGGRAVGPGRGDPGGAGGLPFLCDPLLSAGAGAEPDVHHHAVGHGRRRAGAQAAGYATGCRRSARSGRDAAVVGRVMLETRFFPLPPRAARGAARCLPGRSSPARPWRWSGQPGRARLPSAT